MAWNERRDCSVDGCPTVGRVGQVTCGAVAGVAAMTAFAFGYSVVVAVTSVLPLLSTTAIVFLWAFLWLTTWLGLVVGLSTVRSRVGSSQPT